jgi:hemerythrin-like metal-binding protein
MAITWNEELELGVAEIDEQHRMLVDLINELIDRIEKGEHKQGVLDAIQGMKAYAEFHFAEEEALMRRAGYSSLDEHVSEHQTFVRRAAGFNPGGLLNEREEAEETLDFLNDWFVAHIQDSDRLFVEEVPAGTFEKK